MKKYIIYIIAVVALCCCNKEKYKLEWKVGKGNPIFYKTEVKPIEAQFKKSNKPIKDLEDFYNEMLKIEDDFNLYSILQNRSNEMIGISLIYYLGEDNTHIIDTTAENSIINMDYKGNLIEEDIESNDNNFLSILFKLPSHDISVGDEWKLDINLLDVDNYIIAENTQHRNIVKFNEIKTINDKTIAIIEYDIYSSIEGKLNVLGMSNNISLSAGFYGIGEFDIKEGKWIEFRGILDGCTGHNNMEMSSKQRIQLIESDSVPDAVKKIAERRKIKMDCPITYRVQILSTFNKIPITPENFNVIYDRVELIEKNEDVRFNKYIIGKKCSLEKAEKIRLEMVDIGYKDAFIIKEFNN